MHDQMLKNKPNLSKLLTCKEFDAKPCSYQLITVELCQSKKKRNSFKLRNGITQNKLTRRKQNAIKIN